MFQWHLKEKEIRNQIKDGNETTIIFYSLTFILKGRSGSTCLGALCSARLAGGGRGLLGLGKCQKSVV